MISPQQKFDPKSEVRSHRGLKLQIFIEMKALALSGEY